MCHAFDHACFRVFRGIQSHDNSIPFFVKYPRISFFQDVVKRGSNKISQLSSFLIFSATSYSCRVGTCARVLCARRQWRNARSAAPRFSSGCASDDCAHLPRERFANRRVRDELPETALCRVNLQKCVRAIHCGVKAHAKHEFKNLVLTLPSLKEV
jgi:hypothetical protein